MTRNSDKPKKKAKKRKRRNLVKFPGPSFPNLSFPNLALTFLVGGLTALMRQGLIGVVIEPNPVGKLIKFDSPAKRERAETPVRRETEGNHT